MDSNNILDLVLTSEANRVRNIYVLEPFLSVITALSLLNMSKVTGHMLAPSLMKVQTILYGAGKIMHKFQQV